MIWYTKADDCKSTGPQRGNQKQLKGGHHWHSLKIHFTIKTTGLPSRPRDRTGLIMLLDLFLVRFFSLIFLFVSCGGLSWLHVSFWLHVKYTLVSYRVVSKSRIEARFSTFSLIAVTGYRSHHSHAVRPVELIGYFVGLRFGHPLLFCVFHC